MRDWLRRRGDLGGLLEGDRSWVGEERDCVIIEELVSLYSCLLRVSSSQIRYDSLAIASSTASLVASISVASSLSFSMLCSIVNSSDSLIARSSTRLSSSEGL